ncbi:MAG: cyclic nucleotide-binding domain-containing protein [Candidatus Gracilibacteria bacterium]|nr:cyclic nucleotide-binding domain-containing protein [Candidatus Gracilibacteria bacterium]
MSILNSVELFDSLSDSERNTLSLFCQERLVHSGEVLFYEGDDAVALYVVKRGSLKAYKERSDGEKVLGYIGTGELAGEMALFDPSAPKIRIASVRAVDDTLLLVIMDYAILELSKKHPEIYGKIAQIIMKRKTIAL